MEIYDLKTNYQENPMGIELSGITFSWKVKEAAGDLQEASRVRIWETDKMEHPVYDSGEMILSSGAFTPEVSLKPGIPYCWQVTVKDDAGDLAVSDCGFFEGGHPEEPWHGSWIEPPFVREIHPVFQKEFTISGNEMDGLERARLYICGLGVYEVYLNGEKVGEDYLAPYFTDYRYWVQYQSLDVAGHLKTGVNRIDVYLGNGWYKGRLGYTNKGQLREYYGDGFKLLADLYLVGKDGSSQVVSTDESWLALKSPIVVSGIYDGEMYDARMEGDVLCAPERQKLYARKAQAPEARLCPMVGLPVRKQEVLPVKEVITTPTGETVLDFGQEITGWVVFRAKAPAGARIVLQHGEVLQNGCFYRDNLRSAQAEYTFISRGVEQVARPHFTFFGFRYVKVTGMKVDAASAGDFEAWALYSQMKETGFLTTSDQKVNQLISNTKWSQKDNFLDIPTDCPQRDERLGWTGDAQIFSNAASYHMETPAFFRKYMKDMRLEQQEKGGAVPYVVPDILTIGRQMNGEPEFDMTQDLWGEAGASVWGDAATVIPWNLYLHYGNKKWLEEQYSNMKQWVDFVISMDETHCQGRRLWTCGFHFGDWLSLDSEGDSREGGTDKHLVASVFYMYSAQLTARAAGILQKTEDQAYYQRIAEEVRQALRAAYVQEHGCLTVETQTSYTLGIWFGLFEKEEMAAAGERLCSLLHKNQGHLSTGFVGTAYLCQALTKTGHVNEAYDLLLNEEYPGWLYEVNLGATTIWERWNSLLPDGSISSTGMNSLNHYAYGVIVEWIYEYALGLRHTEYGAGGNIMEFAPNPCRQLASVRGEYHSAAGRYQAAWEYEGDCLSLHFEVPFDGRIRLRLPEGMTGIQVNGEAREAADLEQEWGKGTYRITGRME